MKSLTLSEWNWVYRGYYRRNEDTWDHTRHIMGTIINFGGMGSKEYVPVEQVMYLKRDSVDEIKPIRTKREALELLKEMMQDY